MKPKVYIETTIPSYLAASRTRDLIVAAHQEITRQWWLERQPRFDLFISRVCSTAAYQCPIICTPEALLEE